MLPNTRRWTLGSEWRCRGTGRTAGGRRGVRSGPPRASTDPVEPLRAVAATGGAMVSAGTASMSTGTTSLSATSRSGDWTVERRLARVVRVWYAPGIG